MHLHPVVQHRQHNLPHGPTHRQRISSSILTHNGAMSALSSLQAYQYFALLKQILSEILFKESKQAKCSGAEECEILRMDSPSPSPSRSHVMHLSHSQRKKAPSCIEHEGKLCESLQSSRLLFCHLETENEDAAFSL